MGEDFFMKVLEIIEKEGAQSFAELVKKLNIKEEELGDFYSSLCLNNKIYSMPNGKWDLKSRHKLEEFENKVELEEEETEEIPEEESEEDERDDFIFDEEEC